MATPTETGPKRIQLRRTKGWRKPAGTIVVARPGRFSNPFKVGCWARTDTDFAPQVIRSYGKPGMVTPDHWTVEQCLDRAMAAVWFRLLVAEYRRNDQDAYEAWLAPLTGHDLACWCPLPRRGHPDACHGAVLLELANSARP